MCSDDRWYGIPHHNVCICYESTHDSPPSPFPLWRVKITVLTWYVLNPLSCSAYCAVIGYWGNCNLMLCSSDWCWKNYVNVLVHALHLSQQRHPQLLECLGQDQSLVLYTKSYISLWGIKNKRPDFTFYNCTCTYWLTVVICRKDIYLKDKTYSIVALCEVR